MLYGVGARIGAHDVSGGVVVKVGKHRACAVGRMQASLAGAAKNGVGDTVKRGQLSKRNHAGPESWQAESSNYTKDGVK